MSEPIGRPHEFDAPRGESEVTEAETPAATPLAPPAAARTPQANAPLARRKAPPLKSIILGGVVLAALIAGGYALQHYMSVGRFIVSTDDAYTRTDLAIIAPKISGYIDQVAVVDNQHVRAGDLLVQLDPGDYQLAVDAAAQKVQTEDASIARIRTQIEAQKSTIAQAQAQIDSAKAEATRAEAELLRAQKLVIDANATRQRLDQAQADRDKAVAAGASAAAALTGANATLGVLSAQIVEAERARAELATAQARAERDLGFAQIKAPFDGVVGNRVAQPGQYVQPGARLMALAPDGHYYVEANFKETQLERLVPGQKAEVHVDALGGRTFDGEVESIAPASGSDYSLLPPENATGNFTKIIQRFPVRIRVRPEAQPLLRSGMSVVVDVDTRPVDTRPAQKQP